jgi:hypothetical protein
VHVTDLAQRLLEKVPADAVIHTTGSRLTRVVGQVEEILRGGRTSSPPRRSCSSPHRRTPPWRSGSTPWPGRRGSRSWPRGSTRASSWTACP